MTASPASSPARTATIAAAAVVRIAVCHYVIAGGSPDQFLAELRHAAGLGASRRRLQRAAAG